MRDNVKIFECLRSCLGLGTLGAIWLKYLLWRAHYSSGAAGHEDASVTCCYLLNLEISCFVCFNCAKYQKIFLGLILYSQHLLTAGKLLILIQEHGRNVCPSSLESRYMYKLHKYSSRM